MTEMVCLLTLVVVAAGMVFLVHHTGKSPEGIIGCLILLCAFIVSIFIMPFPSMRAEMAVSRMPGTGENVTSLLFRPPRP
jgi:hypothetical protein